MREMLLYIQAALVRAVPWLIGAAVVCFLLGFAVQSRPLAREWRLIRGLTPFRKFAVLVVLAFFTLWGGSKDFSLSPGHLLDVILPDGETEHTNETVQNVEPTGFAVTGFAVDSVRNELTFELAWPTNFFASANSRDVDLFMSTNLMERRWTPLGSWTMPSETNVCVLTLSPFLAVFGGMAFFRFGLDFDTDADGLTDAYEAFVSLTDPNNPDTDGDGLPDGWEVAYGLNPHVDDSAADFDDDGISNWREYELGTSPVAADTDGDGLSDREEVGWWEYANPLPVFDVLGGTNLLQSSRWYNNDTFVVPLPFTLRCAGYVHTNLTVGVCGMVGLMQAREGNYPFPVSYANQNLVNYTVNRYHTAIAAYWDDLYAPQNSTAQITVADVVTNGLHYAVVEYANIRLYSRRTDAACAATFQIVIPQAEPNTVYVHYIRLPEAFDGSSATVGAQLPNRKRVHQVSFNAAGAVTNGMVIAYHLGIDSDPTVSDTDGDGLDDGREVQLGTSPRLADTDGDELSDAWEVANGLDPLSAVGDDGADGDPDGDRLPNIRECAYGTNPHNFDTDGDGLGDGLETGGICATNVVPWLVFDENEDLTEEIFTNYTRCVSRPLPMPVCIQGEAVTNLTISANGLVYLNKSGYENRGRFLSGADFSYVIDRNALVLAPYLHYACRRVDLAERPSSVRYGTATHAGVGYVLVEWLNSYDDTSTRQTNALSFQLAIPTNAPDRVYARYRDLTSERMDGRSASVGMQTMGGRWLHSWCKWEAGHIGEDLALEFLFGTNSDPLNADTDGDGLSDAEEVQRGTSPLKSDTDGDGLPDAWEVSNGLNPKSADGEDGAFGDPDHDGLTNLDEYLNNTNPQSADTDGDGVPDGEEVDRETNPVDPSDGGETPTADRFRLLNFNIYGDYAAWEMTIEGLGPEDRRTRRISMGAPSATESSALKMRKGNSYRLTMRWLNCDGHEDDVSPWYCWQAKIDGDPGSRTYDSYSSTRLEGVAEVVAGEGWIADNASGLLTAHIHENEKRGGNVAEGLSTTLYILDDPKVIPDYNRDGKIDERDEARYDARQTAFRFWVNDDNDSGNINDSMNDRPSAGSNGQDDKVNGRGDLLDFTPVLLDISNVFPPGMPESLKERVSWKLESDAVNAVWTRLSASNAGGFHRIDCGAAFGPNLSQNADAATVTALGGGVELPKAFQEHMKTSGGTGVVMIEGRGRGSSLKLKGYLDDSPTAALKGELDINVSSVEEMYRWMCLRNVCGDTSGLGSRMESPSNWPDAECDGRHFVFVHGYNVNVQSARGWASEMFKRLWQSGSQSMFTAVDWFGNESQIWNGVPVLGGEALDYYSNVRHALDSAPNFAHAANGLPGNKVMLAHSLGNVLVSEAAKYYVLSYSKYYMLNAAAPEEAYYDDAINNEMFEHDWISVDSEKWAANWYEHFSDVEDPRTDLKWRGRYSGLHDVVNCYSETEDVLANATLKGWGGAWSIQELFKGTATLHFIPGNCEGGWGFNSEHEKLPGSLTEFAKTNNFTDAELITSPVFRKFDNELLHQTNLIEIARTEINKVLGDGIPATSFAAGCNPITRGVQANISYHQKMATLWPKDRMDDKGLRFWRHSDIGRIAFFYVYRIFDTIVSGGNK